MSNKIKSIFYEKTIIYVYVYIYIHIFIFLARLTKGEKKGREGRNKHLMNNTVLTVYVIKT